MSRNAVRDARLPTKTDLPCPRDKRSMSVVTVGEARVDLCGACQGAFFDSGELFAAAGIAADPSSWDLPETAQPVEQGTLRCPRCTEVLMQRQRVAHEDRQVEIDRCGKCSGIWLDRGELDVLVAIGHAMRPALDAARAKAQADLAAMGDPNFRPRPKLWKVALGAVLLALLASGGYGIARLLRPPPPPSNTTRARGEEGCPCGCDRSKAMASELRGKTPVEARRAIDASLVTIGERENVGYVTERMIEHRLRLVALAREIDRSESGLFDVKARLAHAKAQVATERAERCRVTTIEGAALRVCSELVVHGERVETVKGEPKVIGSCFRWWLSIENLASTARVLALPAIRAASRMPVSRWYEEDGDGERWSGALAPNARVRVNVIGDIPDRLEPGSVVDASMDLDGLVIPAHAEARAVIHFPEVR